MHIELFQKLTETYNAERCRMHVNEIHASDRWFDFAHFRQTARYCATRLERAGLDEVELLELKADGRTRYGDWVLPQAWDAESALLQFDGAATGEPALADYLANPCSLMMFSAPTPHGGITAEVAIVDDPAAALPGTLKGKLILTASQPGGLVPLAKAEGAAGILSDYFPLYTGVRDSLDEMTGCSRWENDLIYPVNSTGIFGFSLSPENGKRVRSAVAGAATNGSTVRLHANVKTRFYNGENCTVSGFIPGNDPAGREVLFCAHLYEPGANDNASGCGALLELATAIKAMTENGELPRPRFGIRFVMGYECAGLMGYFTHHGDLVGRTVAAINMDMVGAAAADRAILHIWHNPLSNWSCMDTLLPALTREYRAYTGDAFEFVETPFSVGDNLLADPAIGVPTVSMIMHPAMSYHSSMDGMDRVDSAVLKRNSVIAGAAALIIALPDLDAMKWLAGEINRHKQAMLAGEARLCKAMMAEAFRHGSIGLAGMMNGEPEGCTHGESCDCVGPLAASADLAAIEGACRIPCRLVRGTITLSGLEGMPRESLKWHPFYNYHLNCPLFWADGRRSLADIAALSAAELGIDDVEQHCRQLNDYIGFLEKQGYVRFL
jgi:hypothetical protein